MSRVTRYTSHVKRQTSQRIQVLLELFLCRSWISSCTGQSTTRHTSHVTRHTSHVTRHTSHVTRHTLSSFSVYAGGKELVADATLNITMGELLQK
jgi:hypothetical protein